MPKATSIKQTLTRYLESRTTPYDIIKEAVIHIPEAAVNKTDLSQLINATSVAKPIIVRNTSSLDGNNFIVALVPHNHALSLSTLQKILNCKIATVSAHDYIAYVKNWAPGMFTPIAEENGVTTIIDKQLCEHENIFFLTENTNELIKLSLTTFRNLHKTSIFDHQFSSPFSSQKTTRNQSQASAQPATTATNKQTVDADAELTIKQRIERITELPPMPEMAQKIIHLNASPYARAEDLSALIELDPSLSAQIMRYAKSSFFGYRGKLTSVQQAVSRVLGYDMVMNIALGLAATSAFRITKNGPLGLEAFWKHAIYSAMLMQMIGKLLPKNKQPEAGILYLSGLLHNFGFLLVGHLFKEEFNKLNQAILETPDETVTTHEKNVLGVNHTEIGAWLMQAWNMPTEIITSIREHHNENYSGVDEQYVHLTLISDRLLKIKALGDAENTELPTTILKKYGLDENQLLTCLENLIEGSTELDTIASTLAA